MTTVNILERCCKFLGWQGGTIHDAKRELENREGRLISMYNQMDGETDMQVAQGVLDEIGTIQLFLDMIEWPDEYKVKA